MCVPRRTVLILYLEELILSHESAWHNVEIVNNSTISQIIVTCLNVARDEKVDSNNRIYLSSYLYGSQGDQTSRERPKSAPYLRLKKNQMTSMCQVFSSTVPAWEKLEKKVANSFGTFFSKFFWSPVSRIVPENVKGRIFFSENFFEIIFSDVFWSPVSRIVPLGIKKKAFGSFWTSFLLQNRKKLMGDFLETSKKFAKKSISEPNKAWKTIFGHGWTRTHVLLLDRPQKSRNLYAKCQ